MLLKPSFSVLCLTVSEDIKYVMERHLFRFGDKLYRQSEGGSIGSVLTGEVAKTRTIIFFKKIEVGVSMTWFEY